MSNILVDKTILEKKLKELESQLSSVIKQHSSELNEQKKKVLLHYYIFKLIRLLSAGVWCY